MFLVLKQPEVSSFTEGVNLVACTFCRRSHMTCSNGSFTTIDSGLDNIARPCERCVKRGIPERCTDEPVAKIEGDQGEAKAKRKRKSTFL